MENEYKSKHAHKPKNDHPWKRTESAEVRKWAHEESKQSTVNNFRKGGGKPQK